MGTRLAKIGGILQETSTEELARQEGLPSAPMSPLGAAGIGASQDMAKMSGTGAQIRATIRETLKERTDVMDVMGEAERGASRGRFQVQQIQQQLQTLGGLGSLDNRVAEMVRARITASQEPVAGLANKVNDKALEDTIKLANPLLTEQDLTNAIDAAKTALEALRSNTSVPNVVAVLESLGISATINESASDLAQKLAATGVYDQATTEDIKDAMDKIALDTKDIKVKDLKKDDLPFDRASAAAVLGVDDTDLGNMTLGEVKSQLAAYRSNTFTNVDELREVLDNPFSSQSQKDFARKRLAELGAVGVTSFEQKANNLQAQMEEGDTVKVGDKQVKVEEIMTDPTLRATIATALDSPEELDKLRKVDSELADWVVKNREALKDIKDELTAGLGDFAANLKNIKDYYADAPPDALDKLVPGWRNATDTDLDILKADQITNLKTVGQVLNGSLVKDDKGKDIPLSSDQRNMALTLLSRLGKDKAIAFPAAMLNSIVTTAGSETEAVDMLNAYTTTSEDKAWQAELAGATIPVIELGTGEFDFTQADYDQFDKFVTMQESGYENLTALQKEIQRLSTSASAVDRLQAIKLSTNLGNIRRIMATKLNPTNVDNIKKLKKDKVDNTKLAEKKQQELNFESEGSSITAKTIDEADKYHPGLKDDMINNISRSFQGHYSYIGDIMRTFLEGRPIEQALKALDRDWPSKKLFNPEKDKTMPNSTRNTVDELFTEPRTLDKLLKGISNLLDLDRKKFGDLSAVSKAGWASGYLFKLRDKKEAEARERKATKQMEYSQAKASADLAANSYSTFISGVLT